MPAPTDQSIAPARRPSPGALWLGVLAFGVLSAIWALTPFRFYAIRPPSIAAAVLLLGSLLPWGRHRWIASCAPIVAWHIAALTVADRIVHSFDSLGPPDPRDVPENVLRGVSSALLVPLLCSIPVVWRGIGDPGSPAEPARGPSWARPPEARRAVRWFVAALLIVAFDFALIGLGIADATVWFMIGGRS